MIGEMELLIPLAHAGHWLFALPPLTVFGGLAAMVLIERRRDDAESTPQGGAVPFEKTRQGRAISGGQDEAEAGA